MKSITYFNLIGRLTSTGTSVAITTDNRGNVVTLTNESIVAVSEDNTVFEMMKVNCATGTMNILYRGLDNSTTVTEVSGNKKERGPNTKIYVTALASDFVSANTPNTFTAKQTFDDIDVIGILTMKTASELDVLGQSNPCAVVANNTARGVLYPSPVVNDRVYNTSVQAEQVYNGTSWDTYGISTPTPLADEAIAGKVKVGSSIEYAAGTDQTGGVYNMPKITDVRNDIRDTSVGGQPINKSFPTGDTLVAGNCVFKETGPTFAEATTAAKIGDAAGDTRRSFPFIGNGVGFSRFKLGLEKFSSPSVALGIRIESDDGTGKPSGTLIDANATTTIAPGDLTTSLVDTTVTLSGTTDANSHGVTLNLTEAGEISNKGVKVVFTSQVGIVSIVKDSDCTATTCYLHDTSNNLLSSASFSSQTATLNYAGIITGNTYYIVAGSGGSSYTSVKQTGVASYPYTSTKLNYTAGIINSVGGYVTESHLLTMNITATTSDKIGIRFKALKDMFISKVYFHASVTATKCYLLSDANAVLDTVDIIAGVATLTTPYKFITGTYFRVESDKAGASYTYRGVTSSVVDRSNVEFAIGSQKGLNVGLFYNITGIEDTAAVFVEDANIYNIVTVNTAVNSIVTDGQMAHYVLYQGTYGSETVNGTNYYGFATTTNNTTTRGDRKRDGAARGTMNNTVFPYSSNVGSYNVLVSLTDSDFAYKIDLYGISTEDKAIGQKPRIALPVSGTINSNQSGMTAGDIKYLTGTPGAIGTVGTNICQVGVAISPTQLRFSKKLGTIGITVGTSPFTRANTTGGAVQVKTTGGTVSDIKVDGVIVAAATSNVATVPAGKSIVVTYSSAPTMVYSDL